MSSIKRFLGRNWTGIAALVVAVSLFLLQALEVHLGAILMIGALVLLIILMDRVQDGSAHGPLIALLAIGTIVAVPATAWSAPGAVHYWEIMRNAPEPSAFYKLMVELVFLAVAVGVTLTLSGVLICERLRRRSARQSGASSV